MIAGYPVASVARPTVYVRGQVLGIGRNGRRFDSLDVLEREQELNEKGDLLGFQSALRLNPNREDPGVGEVPTLLEAIILVLPQLRAFYDDVPPPVAS